jgi:hypothetical protein
MKRVRKVEMETVFGLEEVLYAGSWPVAAHYKLINGKIHPYGCRAYGRPLENPELFLSFARLAARGEGPSDEAILGWVREHGLLHRHDPNQEPLQLPKGEMNQEPMKPEEFRTKAQHAYRLLRTFELHRSGDAPTLRDRIGLQPLPGGEEGDHRWAEVLFDGTLTGHIIEEDETLTDSEILDDALAAVKKRIDPHIKAVHPAFGIEGTLALRAPDLLVAMYWQFAGLIDGKHQLAVCAGCGQLFVKTRGNKDVCKDGCRTAKKRKRDKERAAARAAG